MIYLDEILQGVKTVGITGHIRPDGDCVGSTLGVYNYICDNMPQVDVDIFTQKGLLKESHLPEAKSRLSETEKRAASRKAPAGGIKRKS